MKRILDSYGGVVSTIEVSEGVTSISRMQDAQPIFDNNAYLQTMNDGYSPSRELRRVANVPRLILEIWLKEDGISALDFLRNPKHYRAWLREKVYDRDNFKVLAAPHRTKIQPNLIIR